MHMWAVVSYIHAVSKYFKHINKSPFYLIITLNIYCTPITVMVTIIMNRDTLLHKQKLIYGHVSVYCLNFIVLFIFFVCISALYVLLRIVCFKCASVLQGKIDFHWFFQKDIFYFFIKHSGVPIKTKISSDMLLFCPISLVKLWWNLNF